MSLVKFWQRCPNCLKDTQLTCDFREFPDTEPDKAFHYKCDCCEYTWEVTVTSDGVVTSIYEV